jgi:hypothetical protein
MSVAHHRALIYLARPAHVAHEAASKIDASTRAIEPQACQGTIENYCFWCRLVMRIACLVVSHPQRPGQRGDIGHGMGVLSRLAPRSFP